MILDQETGAETYRLLFERHPSLTWVYDPETLRLLAASDAVVAASGYSRQELLAMTTSDFLEPDERRRLHTYLEAGSPAAGQWRLRPKGRPAFDVETTVTAVEFEGRAARLVLARDVTEQLRLEEELRQGQKMEALGRLAGGIAHDFNNLLVVIRGYGEMLLDRLEGDDRTCVEQIADAAALACEFTTQLLAFSRRRRLSPEPTAINPIVRETLRLLERSLGSDIAIETDLSPRLGAILVDRNELTKAVLNLAVNARDAMAAGGTLRVRTAPAEGGVVLEISDTGTGMDDETRRRAFDPFFTTKEHGTGLGLSSVYGLVIQSGGRVELESAPGCGTTFKLYFPVADAVPASPPSEEPVASARGQEVVLLVEDMEIVRDVIVRTLESYGYHVLTAAHAAEALERAAAFAGEIDLLLTDLVMPNMDGRELAEALTAVRPQLRVLFTSGYAAEPDVQLPVGEHEPGFIGKPFLPQDLAASIRRLLDHS